MKHPGKLRWLSTDDWRTGKNVGAPSSLFLPNLLLGWLIYGILVVESEQVGVASGEMGMNQLPIPSRK